MYDQIKVIVCDIDGTLAPAGENPSAQTIETLEALRRKGYLLGLASGRPGDDLLDKYEVWGMSKQFDFIIGWNGCDLIDFETGKKYQYNKLKKEWIKEIIELMEEFDANVHMYKPGSYIASNDTDKAWYSAYKNKRKYIICNDVSAFYDEDNCGIMFRYNVSQDKAIHEKLKQIEGKDYIAFNTQKDLLEFSHKDSNKGYALKEYCELHNISLDEVMAFGDTDNDNEMLRICHGVCLKDGSEKTKEISEMITDKNCAEDGFADFAERYLL